MAENDLELALESALERLASLESRSGENALDITGLKKVDDGQQVAMTKFEARLAADKLLIEELRTSLSKQEAINNDQHNAITDLQRRLGVMVDRLDGKGLLQVDPYERIVATVREHSDVLRGGEGQLSFSQLRNSIQQTQFLGQTIKAMIGLFGVGGVAAAGFALFGKDGVSPELQAVQSKIADIRSDVDKLQSNWDQDLQRRLSERKN